MSVFYLSLGKDFKKEIIKGKEIKAERTSEIDWAFSRPFKPKNTFMIKIHGIKLRPDRKAAKKLATVAFPMD